MNGRLAALTDRQGGVFTRAQALSCGYDDGHLQMMVRSGAWHRVRRGAYTDKAAYSSLDRIARHRVLAHAVTLSMGDGVVISHASAAVLHGLADWSLDLSRVHVTRVDEGASRVEPDVHHHVGGLASGDVVVVDGLRLVSPVRAVLETACTSDLEAGLVVADSALHSGLVFAEQLRAVVDENRQWPGARNAGGVVALADGRSESVGESRLRYLMHIHELPAPVLQYEARRGDRFVGRVDFCFP